MYQFHDNVISPLLLAIGARSVLEVGADQGAHTALLQDWCRDAGATLHVVEPEPSEALLALLDEDVTVLHVGTSHDVIPTLPPIDAAMVDGDHNHYTVTGEVDRLADLARAHGRPLPLMCFHDVGFPYGRRDMYYAPERIPEGRRQPHATDAIQIGRSDLTPPPGFNHGFANATHEGGPRNGVLTGVEDALADIGGIALTVLPGVHGLAVAVPEDRLERNRALRALWQELRADGPLRRLLAVVEDERLAALGQVHQEAWDKAQARDLAERLEGQLSQARAELEVLSGRVAQLEGELAQAREAASHARPQPHAAESDPPRAQAGPLSRARDAVRGVLSRDED